MRRIRTPSDPPGTTREIGASSLVSVEIPLPPQTLYVRTCAELGRLSAPAVVRGPEFRGGSDDAHRPAHDGRPSAHSVRPGAGQARARGRLLEGTPPDS